MSDKTADREWEKVRSSFAKKPDLLWYQITEKTLTSTAMIDLKRRRVDVNSKFLEELVESGCPRDVALNGLFAHELSHSVYFPASLEAQLVLGEMADTLFKEKGSAILGQYWDIITNIAMVLNGRGNSILKLYEYMEKNSGTRLAEAAKEFDEKAKTDKDFDAQKAKGLYEAGYNLFRLSTMYYQYHADGLGHECNINIGDWPKLRKKMPELIKIPFLYDGWKVYKNNGLADKESIDEHMLNMYRYGYLVEDLIPESPQQDGDGQNQQGEDQDGPGKNGTYNDEIKPSDDDIKKALKKIMRDYGRGQYERVKDFAKKHFDYKEKSKIPQKSIGVGTEGGELQVNPRDVEYYGDVSRLYPLYIAPKPMISDAEDTNPSKIEEFACGDPIMRLLPYSSGGKIMPGITKKIEDEPSYKIGEQLKYPHCLIIIDSSGSMDHPSGQKAAAPLAGCCIARNYWENGSYVGVLNFSGHTVGLDFTRELQDIFTYLVLFQGGGTVIDMDKLNKVLPKDDKFKIDHLSPEEIMRTYGREFIDKDLSVDAEDILGDFERRISNLDTHIITDGGIYNLNEVLTHIDGVATHSRTTIYHIGDYFPFDQETFPGNVSLYRVNKPEDLMSVTIGEMRQIFS